MAGVVGLARIASQSAGFAAQPLARSLQTAHRAVCFTVAPTRVRIPRLFKYKSVRFFSITNAALAGVVGFEPTDDGVRVRSLTAWRYPFTEINYT